MNLPDCLAETSPRTRLGILHMVHSYPELFADPAGLAQALAGGPNRKDVTP